MLTVIWVLENGAYRLAQRRVARVLQLVDKAIPKKGNEATHNKMKCAWIVILVSTCLTPVTGKKTVIYGTSSNPNTDHVYSESGGGVYKCATGVGSPLRLSCESSSLVCRTETKRILRSREKRHFFRNLDCLISCFRGSCYPSSAAGGKEIQEKRSKSGLPVFKSLQEFNKGHKQPLVQARGSHWCPR